MRTLGQLPRKEPFLPEGAGPCQLSLLDGPAPSGGPGSEREEQDENQKKHPQQHHNGTPLSAVWGQKGQRLQGDGIPPLQPPPTLVASPRGLTTCHVGYFGHLPEDPIHPGLGVVHLMSEGIQHAVDTNSVSAPKSSVHNSAAN